MTGGAKDQRTDGQSGNHDDRIPAVETVAQLLPSGVAKLGNNVRRYAVFRGRNRTSRRGLELEHLKEMMNFLFLISSPYNFMSIKNTVYSIRYCSSIIFVEMFWPSDGAS